MSDMSQTYRHHFAVFATYRFEPTGPGDGELCDFRLLLATTSPLQRPVDVTHLAPDALYNMVYERELTLQLEAHAETARLLAAAVV